MSNRPNHRPTRRPAQIRGAEANRSRVALLVGGGLVALAMVVAVAVGAAGSDSDGSLEVAPVIVSGQLAELTDGDEDPAVGQEAPAFEATSLDGDPVRITPGDGTARMIVFLAHWCGHCQAEVPGLVDWMDKGLPEGVEVIGVSTLVDRKAPNYPASEWLESEGWEAPTVLDDEASSLAKAFGLSGTPFFVAVDAEGDVLARYSGGLSTATLDALADELAS